MLVVLRPRLFSTRMTPRLNAINGPVCYHIQAEDHIVPMYTFNSEEFESLNPQAGGNVTINTTATCPHSSIPALPKKYMLEYCDKK